MRKDQKKELIAEFHALFEDNNFVVTDFTGVKVNSINTLRHKLHAENVEYVVVKNTLAQIALKNCGLGDLSDRFSQNNGVAFVKGDPVKLAKVLKEYAKTEAKFKIKFGVLEKQYIDQSQVEALAELPDKNTLIAVFMGTLMAPLTNFVRMINQPLTSFACAVKQLAEKQEN